MQRIASYSLTAMLALAMGTMCSVASSAELPILLKVDVRDAPRKLLHTTEIIPAKPGPMTLAYPQWLPSVHLAGPIDQQAGLFITAHHMGSAAATPIRWERDPVDLYLYHIVVPKGASSIEVSFDFMTAADATTPGSTDANIAALNWNTVLMYPYHGPSTQVASIEVTPTIVLPPNWHFASALQSNQAKAPSEPSNAVTFHTVSLEQLVDSPVISGCYFREIPLAPEITPKHYLDLVADTPASLQIDQAHIDKFSEVVRQAGVLFHSRHYDSFHMLVTLSDQIAGDAFDHHQSLDDRRPANFLTSERSLTLYGDYIVHDFVHSWNGKYRRPQSLMAANYQMPIIGTDLWIYEGLTDYLAGVLTVRSGIWTQQQYLDQWSEKAAHFDRRPGKTWRDLQDTATMAPILWAADSSAYESWRLGGYDFYGEGALMWLDVDTTIRNGTAGKKSLDDFLALFYGQSTDSGPTTRPFTRDNLVNALNTVYPHDWASFFQQRLHELTPGAPLEGFTHGGYRLVYRDAPNAWTALSGKKDFENSIAMKVRSDGVITDVLIGGIADKAGFASGMKMVSVNGKPFSIDQLQHAIRNAKGAHPSIEFAVENDGAAATLTLAYHGGEQYPALERIVGTKDRLLDIAAPR
ncbi:M61 family peptidase [Dyella monticola]|uniref:M61 family peptidase n=1 Tax=Dyella monticola TaxID=1927958 RepID=A0A370X1R4_9GAMM|nr:M61 family metallopeptidase [Dyella monticola]RDS82354.1 M61 family peptidase [Dyella monticola]